MDCFKPSHQHCHHHSLSRCGPRLSEAAGAKLQNRYVLMRGGTREAEAQADKRLAIPITVRYSLLLFQLSAFYSIL